MKKVFELAKKHWKMTAIILLTVVSSMWYVVSRNTTAETTYQTAKVEKGTLVSSISASGNVLTTNTLSISTEASGVVKKVYVKDGDKVVVGQKVAEITLDLAGQQKSASSYSSYISAQNSLASANSSYRSAQASADVVLEEVKGHDTDETLTQKEARTKVEVARDNAYNGIKTAQANLSASALAYKSSSPIITVPYGGVIDSIGLVEGMVLEGGNSSTDTASSSVRVAVIKNNSAPIVSVTLSEIDVPKVKVGQKATVSFDSLVDKTFTGVVATVDRIGTVSSNVVSYIVNIKLDSTSDEILPNMAATANIIIKVKSDVLLIPSSGVQTSNEASTVRVMRDGQIISVQVEMGESNDTQTEILSGINEGETIVTGQTESTTTGSTGATTSPFGSTRGGFGGTGGLGGGAVQIQRR